MTVTWARIAAMGFQGKRQIRETLKKENRVNKMKGKKLPVRKRQC